MIQAKTGLDGTRREERILRARVEGQDAQLPRELLASAEAALRTAFALHDAMENLSGRGK